MSDLKEINEAKAALLDVKEEIGHILDKVNNAKRWGIADIFMDSMLTSMVKRNKIKDINSDLKRLQSKLMVAKEELSDVDINFESEISDTGWDNFFDIFFDNIFTDLRVNSEIKEIRENLMDLDEKVDEILKKLN
ncbi:hypothetical protein KQI68_00840 [Peptoniphilus sp. MSJ-1]|uniref:DUF5082 domain-containing protein n=1 Tax=Peptoniphilus ovalis TaxID=2841503 RepID=A0ABS6FDW3_9FIRM|nr:hypothetical protein [Peptoniphilus ovalis]MBU5668378.1 hypothetical protein [Peptoniphilus ovalis]